MQFIGAKTNLHTTPVLSIIILDLLVQGAAVLNWIDQLSDFAAFFLLRVEKTYMNKSFLCFSLILSPLNKKKN